MEGERGQRDGDGLDKFYVVVRHFHHFPLLVGREPESYVSLARISASTSSVQLIGYLSAQLLGLRRPCCIQRSVTLVA